MAAELRKMAALLEGSQMRWPPLQNRHSDLANCGAHAAAELTALREENKLWGR